MSEVKKYGVSCGCVVESNDGLYVLHTDYAAVKAERDVLARALVKKYEARADTQHMRDLALGFHGGALFRTIREWADEIDALRAAQHDLAKCPNCEKCIADLRADTAALRAEVERIVKETPNER